MVNILKSTSNVQMAAINGHDPLLASVVTHEGCAPTGTTDDDLELNTKAGQVLGLTDSDNAILNDVAFQSIPPPVCTSTPTAWRPKLDVFSSTVAFPNPRLDLTGDSGLGDTFHSTPSHSATDSPYSYSDITDVISPTVSVNNCKTDTEEMSSSPTLSLCLSSSMCRSPIFEGTGTQSVLPKFTLVHERISSTPISQTFVGRPLISEEIAKTSDASPMCQPLLSTDSFHIESRGSIATIPPLALQKNEGESEGETSDDSSMSFENESGSLCSVEELDEDNTSNVPVQFSRIRPVVKENAQAHCSLHFQRSKKKSDDEASMPSESETESENPCLLERQIHPLVQSKDLAEDFDKILRMFSPPVPDRLIGRYIGEEYFDIFVGLYDRMIPACGIITWLHQYLTPRDFFSMCGVCKRWRQICLADVQITRYHMLRARLRRIPTDKENVSSVRLKLTNSAERAGVTRSSHLLGEVQQAVYETNKASSSTTPTLYERVRPTLKWGDKLRHCPFCNSVAKIIEGEDCGKCQNPACKIDFCTRCKALYHPHPPCKDVIKQNPVDKVCGKKCKKNLKRIAHLSDNP